LNNIIIKNQKALHLREYDFESWKHSMAFENVIIATVKYIQYAHSHPPKASDAQ